MPILRSLLMVLCGLLVLGLLMPSGCGSRIGLGDDGDHGNAYVTLGALAVVAGERH